MATKNTGLRKFTEGGAHSLLTDSVGVAVGTASNPLQVASVLNSSMFNEYVHLVTGVTSTLAVVAAINDTQLTIVSAVGFVIGNYVKVYNSHAESTFARITNIVGNVLTLDRRLDNAHAIGTNVAVVSFNLAVVGSLVTPVEFFVTLGTAVKAHILALSITMTHSTAGDMGKFGGITALQNGVLIRQRTNGSYKTLTTWKSNDEIADDMYDVTFNARAGGGGSYGTTARWLLAVSESEIRLDGATSDQLEIYVQDDLTALSNFSIKVQGHYE